MLLVNAINVDGHELPHTAPSNTISFRSTITVEINCLKIAGNLAKLRLSFG
jgi:hypothetical protein